MSARGYSQVLEIFRRAVELDGEARQNFLTEACADLDPTLRLEVRSLLDYDLGVEPTSEDGIPSNEPRTFGRYQIVEEIGRGGMAVVYLAEQRKPVRRRVALKVIKVGMDTRELIRRFESERQALALMSHRNIADVYDAGSTENGRPYFAMEYVDGVPVTDYCDAFRLSVQERLELFCAVCDGVQHAHQKGIIHRDLKPSNVLVRIEGETPVPKIIDFGVAKAIAQPLIDATMNTRFGHLIGTPAYMSPEQAQPMLHDIDTRADVYALGVLLHELLVGRLPFDLSAAGDKGIDEIRRVVAEREAQRPSTGVSVAGVDASATARRRRLEPAALARRLRGDLDWIVLKALEKDRTRRYPSASELAQDVARHLAHEPVEASPPTASYRIGKFVRRHRLGVAASAVVLLTMTLGVAGTTLGLLRAREEAHGTRQTLDFVTDLFGELDPERRRGEALTALELLDRGAEQASRVGQYEPLVRARLLDTIGKLYVQLGSYEAAFPLLEEALALRLLELPEDHLDIAVSRGGLSNILYVLERYQEAEALSRRALAVQERRLGGSSPLVATTLNDLGLIRAKQGDFAGAHSLVSRALEILAEVPPADLEQVPALKQSANVLNSLGGIYLRQDLLTEAEEAFARALAIRERYLEPDHPDLATSLHNYGLLLLRRGRLKEAIPPLERALRVRERVLGADHVRVAASLSVLGEVLKELEEFERAEDAHRRALVIRRAAYGEEHGHVAQSLYNLSEACFGAGKAEDAERLMRQSVATIELASGGDSPHVLFPLRGLATQLSSSGRSGEARDVVQRAIDVAERQPVPDEALLVELRGELARLDGVPPSVVLASRPKEIRP